MTATSVKLYLDMDGVLADFDKRADEILGVEASRYEFRHGSKKLWERLNAVPDFFYSFDPMPDFHDLWNATKHLHPEVLTALPYTNGDEVRRQKLGWVEKHMGSHVKVHTCLTKEKPKLSKPGAILVDDRNINEEQWQLRGGYFIHHADAVSTLTELRHMGVI